LKRKIGNPDELCGSSLDPLECALSRASGSVVALTWRLFVEACSKNHESIHDTASQFIFYQDHRSGSEIRNSNAFGSFAPHNLFLWREGGWDLIHASASIRSLSHP